MSDQVLCARCGTSNPLGQRFCGQCGQSLDNATSAGVMTRVSGSALQQGSPTALLPSIPSVPTVPVPGPGPGPMAPPIYPPPAPNPPPWRASSAEEYPSRYAQQPPVTFSPTIVQQVYVSQQTVVPFSEEETHPSTMVRLIYFGVIGWWLGSTWLMLALCLMCTVIGIPLGMLMLKFLPKLTFL
jgi:hypothetical protein